jgi:hypothetical protein
MNLVDRSFEGAAVLVPVADLDGVTGGGQAHRIAGPRAAHANGTADTLPPIHVIKYSDGRVSVLDGAHRLQAAREAGAEYIAVIWHYHPEPLSMAACQAAHAPHVAARDALTREVFAEVNRRQASGAFVDAGVYTALQRSDPSEAKRLLNPPKP